MISADFQAIYRKNLSLLKSFSPKLYDRLNSTKINEDFVLEPIGQVFNLKIHIQGESPLLLYEKEPLEAAKNLLDNQSYGFPPRILAFFGLGLGYHLFEYLKKPNPYNNFIIIIEHSLEIFRKALFLNDFSEIFNNGKITFFIEEAIGEVKLLLDKYWYKGGKFLNTNAIHNVILEDSLRLSPQYYVNFAEELSKSIKYTTTALGNDCEDQFMGLRNIFLNLKEILKNPTMEKFEGIFKGIPGLLICTGPSLQYEYENLRALGGKRAVMVACDSAFSLLIERGITPHFVSTIERKDILANFYKGVQGTENSVLIAPPLVDVKVYEYFRGKRINIFSYYPTYDWLPFEKKQFNLGASCSNLGFLSLHLMGCSPIIIIGNDLSYNQVNGDSHTPGVIENNDSNMSLEVRDKRQLALGNNGKMLETKNSWVKFRDSYELAIYQKKITAINAIRNNLGLKINGALTLEPEQAFGLYLNKEFDISGILSKQSRSNSQEIIEKNRQKIKKKISEYLIFLAEFRKELRVISERLLNSAVLQDANVNDLFEKTIEEIWIKQENFRTLLYDIIAPEHIHIMRNLYCRYGNDKNSSEEKIRLGTYWFKELVPRWLDRLEEILKKCSV